MEIDFVKYVEKAEQEGRLECYYCNRIDFYFITESDGWISVLRNTENNIRPLIQTKDRSHAIQFCELVEPVDFSIKRL